MKKKKNIPKTNKFVVLDSIEATKMKMPKYNGYAGGYGPHGHKGYNRKAENRRWKKEEENE